MKKIHRQPGPSTSGPPISHAVVAPIPPSAPQIPSALFRSEPSAKLVEMIDRAVGVMMAAPAPRTTRAASSAAGDQASPHSSDAVVKRTVPSSTFQGRFQLLRHDPVGGSSGRSVMHTPRRRETGRPRAA
jgi:hypothetical protein